MGRCCDGRGATDVGGGAAGRPPAAGGRGGGGGGWGGDCGGERSGGGRLCVAAACRLRGGGRWVGGRVERTQPPTAVGRTACAVAAGNREGSIACVFLPVAGGRCRFSGSRGHPSPSVPWGAPPHGASTRPLPRGWQSRRASAAAQTPPIPRSRRNLRALPPRQAPCATNHRRNQAPATRSSLRMVKEVFLHITALM